MKGLRYVPATVSILISACYYGKTFDYKFGLTAPFLTHLFWLTALILSVEWYVSLRKRYDEA